MYDFELHPEWGVVDSKSSPSMVNHRIMMIVPFTDEEIEAMPMGVISEKTFEMEKGYTLTVTATVERR